MGPIPVRLRANHDLHQQLRIPRESCSSANGIRTRVWALRGPRPSPLDDSAGAALGRDVLRSHILRSHILRATPCVQHPASNTLRATPCEQHPASNTLHPREPVPTQPQSSRPGRTRTCNPRFWRPVLHQLSYGPTPLDRAGPRPREAERKPAIDAGPSSEGWLTGIEPATPGTTIRCSNRLSYSHRVGFFNPSLSF
jgi:hypothetical protein